MGKAKSPRRVGDNEALSVGTQIRGSAQKLNLVAALIRGRKVEEALNILSFSKRARSCVSSGRRKASLKVCPRTSMLRANWRSSDWFTSWMCPLRSRSTTPSTMLLKSVWRSARAWSSSSRWRCAVASRSARNWFAMLSER